jgi:hypothetical protein
MSGHVGLGADQQRPLADQRRPLADQQRPLADQQRPLADQRRPLATSKPHSAESANGVRTIFASCMQVRDLVSNAKESP